MPNTRGIVVEDSIANHRVYKVGRPALYRVAPTPEKNRGIAVIICPGGGYQRYAWEVAGWALGLKFRARIRITAKNTAIRPRMM